MANLISVSLETSSEPKLEEWQKTSIAFIQAGFRICGGQG